jgi:hypothetical protein
MKANELRIGNWVYQGNQYGDMPIDAYQIHQYDLMERGGSVAEYYKEWKPIPLTAKLLEEFGGLRYAPRPFAEDHFTMRILGVDTIYFRPSYQDGFYWGIATRDIENPDELHAVIPIKYLHQLQNLYFTLTGKELKP